MVGSCSFDGGSIWLKQIAPSNLGPFVNFVDFFTSGFNSGGNRFIIGAKKITTKIVTNLDAKVKSLPDKDSKCEIFESCRK